MNRREAIGLGESVLLASGWPGAALAERIPRALRARHVRVKQDLPAGEIHVFLSHTSLYWIFEPGEAVRYPVAVGAAGRNLTGRTVVGRKAEWPSWRPTPSMIAAEPEIYGPYREGLPGGHEMNPLGARALYLHRGGRDTLYRIHGTPQPWTIGRSFGSGCIRMFNAHVEHLYARIPVGTAVTIH